MDSSENGEGFVFRFRRIILVLGLMIGVISIILGSGVIARLSPDSGFEDPNADSTRALAILRDKLNADESPVLVLFDAKGGSAIPSRIDTPEFQAEVEKVLAKAGDNPEVRSIYSYYSTGLEQFKSRDGTMTYAVMNISYGRDFGFHAYGKLREVMTSETLRVRFGGEVATNFDNEQQMQKDIVTAELISFPLLAVLLLWVFGSVISAAIPLMLGGFSIIVSLAMLRIVTEFTEVAIYAANMVTMLGLGLSIDYSLFVVSRFREELRQGSTPAEAVRVSINTAGRTIFFSGITVLVSILSLLVYPQRFFHSMGISGAIAVSVAAVSSVTLLPAFLGFLGLRVDALPLRSKLRRNVGLRSEPGESGWYRLSHFVMRHSVSVFAVTLTVLLLLGAPFLRARIGFADVRALPSSSEARSVLETVTGGEFPRGTIESILVAIRTRGDVTEASNLAALALFVEHIKALPGVHKVDSLVTLDEAFSLEDYQQLYATPDEMPMAADALKLFASGEYTRMTLYYDYSHHSPEAQELVAKLRVLPRPPEFLEYHLGGYPAFITEYLASLKGGIPKIAVWITAIICLVLFAMLGSVVVPLKAVALNFLSLSVSLGAMVYIFQDGNFSEILGFTPLGALDGSILIVIFVVAFGLSMDYEVFLLSRIKEQYDLTGDTTAAVALGVQKTGAIITNAAILIAVVFGAFAMGKIVFMKEIGIGLFIAVVVDATLIRMLLVPATMQLMGKWNWWLPAPLVSLHKKIDLGRWERH